MADDNGRAEGEDNVLVVGVEQEPVVGVAWVREGVPEKPMTALMSRFPSPCISSFKNINITHHFYLIYTSIPFTHHPHPAAHIHIPAAASTSCS